MRTRVLSFVITLASLGCNQPPTAGMIDQSLHRASDCNDCWLTVLDNPTIYGLDKVSVVTSPGLNAGPEAFEDVTRTPQGFRTGQFKLTVMYSAESVTSEASLLPVPAFNGAWTATRGGPTTYPWQASGILLGYGKTDVHFMHLDAWNRGAAQSVKNTARVELDPSVMLVPVQVVRAVPPKGSSYSYLGAGDLAAYQSLFDATPYPEYETTNISHPEKSNVASVHTQATGAHYLDLPWDRPDSVWAQCGIQFRMVDCSEAGKGCPSLPVDALHMAPRSCEEGGIQPFLSALHNRGEAEKLPGIRTDVPIAVMMAKVSGECSDGVPLDVATRGYLAAGILSSRDAGARLSLAHELGHVLGLDDDRRCATPHLMCAFEEQSIAFIRPEECVIARQAAAQYVKAYWVKTVDPNSKLAPSNIPDLSAAIEETAAGAYRLRKSVLSVILSGVGTGFNPAYIDGHQVGYTVGQVYAGHPLALLGLRPSDTLLSIAGVKLTSDADVWRAYSQANSMASFDVFFEHDGTQQMAHYAWF